jgi:hypothetical protein|tara:strand:+ start:1383 stop:1775 length:393 start_codon:yes stop_codon:yes gene_type:complete
MKKIENEHQLREAINNLILEQESETRLRREVVKVGIRLVMAHDAHVPDTLTRIRVLPSVAVVGQKEPVNRTEKGSVYLEIYVKYLPTTSETYKSLIDISKLIKTLPGIKVVRILSVGGKSVLYKDKPIVV